MILEVVFSVFKRNDTSGLKEFVKITNDNNDLKMEKCVSATPDFDPSKTEVQKIADNKKLYDLMFIFSNKGVDTVSIDLDFKTVVTDSQNNISVLGDLRSVSVSPNGKKLVYTQQKDDLQEANLVDFEDKIEMNIETLNTIFRIRDLLNIAKNLAKDTDLSISDVTRVLMKQEEDDHVVTVTELKSRIY